MALTGFYGSKRGALIGPSIIAAPASALQTVTIDAVSEAMIFIGRVETSDGASHTIDTTGSSSIGWRTSTVTFANAGTTMLVGIAAVDTANGPPARAVNVADVITFDVVGAFVGGGGGVTTAAWQASVPTTGTKTIANGDLVAVCFQMTTRAGADSILASYVPVAQASNRPVVTSFTGSTYAALTAVPDVLITFSDGATGWISGSLIASSINTRTWNSSSGTKEYGQLYQLPFPTKIYGVYGWQVLTADCDVVLYSDPLGGSPVAEKTISFDLNTVGSASGRYFESWFDAPYTTTTDQLIGAVFKPGASNVGSYYKTLNAAGHRVADPWGTVGYGISRSSGAFVNANSSLDHYFIGLIAGAFDNGGGGHIASRQTLGM